MAEAITFEFPVSGSGKKLSGKNMGIDLRNHIIKVEDDGTAYRNFLRVVAQRLSQELYSSVESGDRRP